MVINLSIAIGGTLAVVVNLSTAIAGPGEAMIGITGVARSGYHIRTSMSCLDGSGASTTTGMMRLNESTDRTKT